VTAGLAAALLGCSEESMAPAELAPLCGQAGPAHILPLDTDEVVNESIGGISLGDRTYYGIRRFDHPITNVPASTLPAAERVACGRAGVRRARRAHRIDRPLRW
jgi:hypothetical protein